MSSLNKATIIGNLGNDPELKYTQSGTAVTNISVATTEKWKDQAGELKEKTEWHRVVFFGRMAEVAGEYLRKGAQVYVEGRIETEKWTDKDGVDRYTTKIIGSELKMLGKRESNDNAPRQQQSRPAAAAAPAQDDFADDDNIPF